MRNFIGTHLPAAGMNRRTFLAQASALGLGAGLALSLHPGAARANATTQAQKGGTFRLGMIEGETTDSLDPRLTGTTFMAHLNLQTRNCLVEIGPNMQVVPELAESFEPRNGAATWAFKLRRGVEFHNGKTLDAQDVVYSINLHREANSKSGAKALLKSVTDLSAEGADTVVFKLAGPNVDFPYVLADYHLVIVPAGTTDFSNAMGTGGYILEQFSPGTSSKVRRNPNYWKADRAHFDSVEMTNIADPVTRNNALFSGQVDAIIQTDAKTAELLKGQGGLQLIETRSTQHVTLPMHVDKAPFDNPDLRLALKYAIDRELLVKTLLNGHGTVANDHPIAPVNRFYAADLPQRAYDPDKAKFHLKKAGQENAKLTLNCSDAILGLGVDMALLYQQSARKAGIEIEIQRIPTDGYWDNVWLQKPFYEGFWAGRPTADWMFSQAYARDAAWNEAHWANERFNQLLVNARAELDEGKRGAMYHEMQALCRDDGGSIIPFFTNILDAASDKVKFGALASNLAGDGARCAERWWFA